MCLLVACSLAEDQLCGITSSGLGTYTSEGIDALCEALKSTTTVTSLKSCLKYAFRLESLPTVKSP